MKGVIDPSSRTLNYQVWPASEKDAAGIARVHVDAWRTTYKGIVPDSYLESLSYERREAMWIGFFTNIRPRSHIWVAKDESDEVIGFCDGGPNRNDSVSFGGEINAIYLRQEFQGRGIGKRLFLDSLEQLSRDGFADAVVWVLEDNPAYGFYQAMGGQVADEKWEKIGGKNLKEIAFGWSDIASTLQKLRPDTKCAGARSALE